MSKSLALLSGKGGSGKTSLALSIASLLGKCKLRVLLVDCDLSTNGATYFFEDRINDNTNSLISFSSLFSFSNPDTIIFDNGNYSIPADDVSTLINNKLSYVKVDDYIDFLPSIIKLSSRLSETYTYSPYHNSTMTCLDHNWREMYDVIIYDCEAGYSEILRTILPFVDINLVVMEADAISSAALRSLYLKIGSLFNGKKIFQVFNKATKEEYDIYSKVSGGTVFTNIETVMFDWKIRKAFSLAQIPDIETTSAHYGQQVYNICNIIFREENIQNALRAFEKMILLNNLKEQEQKLRERQESESTKSERKVSSITLLLNNVIISTLCVFLAISIFILLSKQSFTLTSATEYIIPILIIAFFVEVAFVTTVLISRKRKLQYESINQKELEELVSKRKALENQIEQQKQDKE